jgi:tetratricopeptide (TPR) repeat protein
MIARRLGLAALAALGLAACATPAAVERAELRPALPERAEVAGVPFEPQEELWCGPAALAMALSWSGPRVTQAALAPEVYTSGRAGTLPTDLVAAARRHDRLAVSVAELGDLLAELAAGHPVLVLQNLGLGWWPVWHYALAVGYDRAAGELVLRSGSEARHEVALSTFERTWARAGHWGLVILPPDLLPASVDEAAVVRAAAALERTGRLAAAKVAYDAILGRWPASTGALLGRGNVRYAKRDLAGAERAFRRAASSDPGNGAAWNNLAQVLFERGQPEAALESARRAVELGGPLVGTYRTTLRQVEAAGPAPRGSHPPGPWATPSEPAGDQVAAQSALNGAPEGL